MRNFNLITIIISIISVYLLFQISKSIAAETDSITNSQSLSKNQSIVSKKGEFELGFFTLDNSTNHYYLGIWYKRIPGQTVVWVANREKPATNPNSLQLIINNTLLLRQDSNTVLWSVNITRKLKNPILQLLDSGNLVLTEENKYLWQSFDFPGNTLLQGMKLGKDLKTGLDRRVTAWKSSKDPSPGTLNWGMDVTMWPQPMQRVGSKKQFNSGPWIGLGYGSKPTTKRQSFFSLFFISNEDEVYFGFHLDNNSVPVRMVLDQATSRRLYMVWIDSDQEWQVYVSLPRDFCESYSVCGPNSNCDWNKSVAEACGCLRGFRPNSAGGCLRDKPLNCESDGFVKYVKMKVPDTENCWYLNQSMNLDECREKCLRNCSCTAYANSDIRGEGSGCALWSGDLNDLRILPDAGQDLYIRVPASELAFCLIWKRRKKAILNVDQSKEEQEEDPEVKFYDLSVIASSTDNFSDKNKLGEGGFGPVFMGTLENGQRIAVKRLSTGSGQGLNEFKNEIALIAKLQHRNLVKLQGYCIQNEEKLLIYEYMPNKSLDFFIFEQTQRMVLDWPTRFNVIRGITRGLLYLHQDSRLTVIHRDLKASNILLDHKMNPKISDFGLARILGEDQATEITRRIVGTYGYIAPEYAIDGNFSVKSDVYSFGVLLLEIVSGKRNRGDQHQNKHTNLTEYAWKLWMEGRALELISEDIKESCNGSEALRCIHISFLCLEQHPHDRPSMSSVVMMLSSEICLPKPKQPALFVGEYSSSNKTNLASVNELTMSILEPR
ncbi:hypothetical protein PIB30_056216 [Stylosanthes scabra]|uniref:Receptor-like serine/threonine-protein kinase n=1 Tax=Stylosanthes scabra TaxID=79078 RepID=A0ABU6QIR5_9FABA|nr:hypothetical protein [Stylosanthes scabra]